jgi:hypothetical protein
MGKRSRQKKGPVETTAYTDPDGNVLTLRNTVSTGTARKLAEPVGSAAASVDDQWRRRTELLFERLAVRWEIAGLPIEKQSELLGRYRFADQSTQQWIRETIDKHLA